MPEDRYTRTEADAGRYEQAHHEQSRLEAALEAGYEPEPPVSFTRDNPPRIPTGPIGEGLKAALARAPWKQQRSDDDAAGRDDDTASPSSD